MKSVLEKLKIEPVNPGACIGPDGWLQDPNGKELVSYNPTTGESLAKIVQATPGVYEKVAAAAQKAFLTWRQVPAPRRSQVVRDLGDALGRPPADPEPGRHRPALRGRRPRPRTARTARVDRDEQQLRLRRDQHLACLQGVRALGRAP